MNGRSRCTRFASILGTAVAAGSIPVMIWILGTVDADVDAAAFRGRRCAVGGSVVLQRALP